MSALTNKNDPDQVNCSASQCLDRRTPGLIESSASPTKFILQDLSASFGGLPDNSMTILFRPANTSDATAISLLIHSLASYIEDEPVNPHAESYLNTITPQALSERIAAPGFTYIVAEDHSGVCGVAGLRDLRHVYHLFVRRELHRQGLARELWERLRKLSDSSFFTVNSSLFAVPVYTRLGFVSAGEKQSRNGVTVQPMVYMKASQASI